MTSMNLQAFILIAFGGRDVGGSFLSVEKAF